MVHLLTSQSLLDLFVDYDVHLYTSLSGGLEHHVQSISFIASRGPTQVQLWAMKSLALPNRQENTKILGTCRLQPGKPGKPGDVP